VSLRVQAGNADDVLMRALHGPRWRADAGVPPGRRPRHLMITLAGVLALAGLVARRRTVALLGAAGWVAGTAELAWARIAPGPRDRAEVATMLLTSAALPAAAAWHWVAGLVALRWRLRDPRRAPRPPAVDAVLFDRDGTLVVDVPWNGDPGRVAPMPGARAALDRVRRAGLPTAVVSNQSGVGDGRLTRAQVEAVNRRIDELLGPLGPFLVCPHAPGDGCRCRKPSPGLVVRAAALLGVPPSRCAVIGDIGADVAAARAAGARGVLVPTPRTRPEEVAAAPEVAPTIEAAVERLLEDGA
jgi:histidinol-phosphate phosphatase family protein